MQSDTHNELDNSRETVDVQQPKRNITSKSPQIICFVLIVIMNLSAWIDLQGLFVELPLITPLTPERWTLPSIVGLCVCAANIGPFILVLGKKTVVLFGHKRSVWLLGSILTLALLDCTSSLVFFDYMKRFRAHYLSAAFWGDGLTTLLPTLLAILQGVGSEAICIPTGNGTISEPIYSQPRFSATIFLFYIAGIILLSFVAFILLRWTNIVALADAAELNQLKNKKLSIQVAHSEVIPMINNIQSPNSSVNSQIFHYIYIAWQSPCPWMADAIYGSIIMVLVWFLTTLNLAYVRVVIGNRIKMEWIDEKGMFYFGTSTQSGLFIGTIPMFIFINIFNVFVERLPCHTYCKT
ncbi:hypothetical protein I4U23_010796 [Adineta vaga]|nr:hypothetical protein I4U23_010796 [Adineta vaga]